MDRSRHCARPGCGAPATATLSFQYASRTAWIDDLQQPATPSTYDLCPAHADHLRVPLGWSREDRRAPPRPRFYPAIAV